LPRPLSSDLAISFISCSLDFRCGLRAICFASFAFLSAFAILLSRLALIDDVWISFDEMEKNIKRMSTAAPARIWNIQWGNRSIALIMYSARIFVMPNRETRMLNVIEINILRIFEKLVRGSRSLVRFEVTKTQSTRVRMKSIDQEKPRPRRNLNIGSNFFMKSSDLFRLSPKVVFSLMFFQCCSMTSPLLSLWATSRMFPTVSFASVSWSSSIPRTGICSDVTSVVKIRIRKVIAMKLFFIFMLGILFF